jgi:hypothetical protein
MLSDGSRAEATAQGCVSAADAGVRSVLNWRVGFSQVLSAQPKALFRRGYSHRLKVIVSVNGKRGSCHGPQRCCPRFLGPTGLDWGSDGQLAGLRPTQTRWRLEMNQRKAERDKWHWTTRDQLKVSWEQLTGTNDKEKLIWVEELLDRSYRVLVKRNEAAVGTERSHWFQRGSAGASAAVATLTGGTLIGSVHGAAATVIGIGAAIVGLVAAGIVASRPEQSYATDLAQKTQYEQLWWDIRSYAITQLPAADRNSFEKAINTFAEREANIMGPAAPADTNS